MSIKRLITSICLIVVTAFAWGAATAPAAEAAKCTPVAEVYPWEGGFYAIAGARCDAKMHKIAVSGYLYGEEWSSHLFEFSKKCKGKRWCLQETPVLKNPPGLQTYKIAIVGGWKHHWYSVPPKYVWLKRKFRF